MIELYIVALVFGISEEKVNSYRNLLETPRCVRNPYWIARSLATQIWTRWTHMYIISRAKNCSRAKKLLRANQHSSVFGPVQRGNARYFIPDTEVL